MTSPLRNATEGDVESVLLNLRPDDLKEIRAAWQKEPIELKQMVMDHIEDTKSMWSFRGVLAGLVGVSPDPHLEGAGVIWMICTPEVDAVKRELIAEARNILPELCKDYKFVYNWAHKRNNMHVRFLQFLGFKAIDQTILNNEPFIKVVRIT